MNSSMRRIGWLALLVAGCWAGRLQAEEAATPAGPDITLAPTVTYVTVSGNEGRFREDHWITDDWSGGIEDARLHQDLGNDLTLDFSGRGIFEAEEFALQLDLVKKDVGYLRAGFDQFRHYYSSAGGFYEDFSVPSFDPHRDLHLDHGKFYVELGLTMPDLPRVLLGYERQYTTGEKSLLEWGAVTEGAVQRNIFPSFKRVDETVDIIKLEAEHEVGKVRVADQFRVEFYDGDTKRFDTAVDLNSATSKTVTIREDYDHTAFYNTFRMDSHVNEKLYWSLGYLFNNLDGNAGLDVVTPPPLLPFDRNWSTQMVNLDSDSHVVNLNALTGPFGGFSIYGGLQAEQTDTEGATAALLTAGLNPPTQNLIQSDNAKVSLEEKLGVRFTKIPFTTLYAEGAWTEQQIDLNESETEDGAPLFRRNTDTDVWRQQYTAGFNSAPLTRVNLSGRYRRSMRENDYDHQVDTTPGYPAFITSQDFTTDEVMARLTLRPCSKASVAFTYQLVASDIDTGSDAVPLLAPGGSIQSANYNANIYSVSATVTPCSRLYLMGVFSYHDTRTSTFDNGAPSVLAYDGDVYSALGALGYALGPKTDVNLEYVFYRSHNFHDNSADGLPLGLDNESHSGVVSVTQKLNEHVLLRARYGLYYYNEVSNGGIDDYLANLAALTCSVKF